MDESEESKESFDQSHRTEQAKAGLSKEFKGLLLVFCSGSKIIHMEQSRGETLTLSHSSHSHRPTSLAEPNFGDDRTKRNL